MCVCVCVTEREREKWKEGEEEKYTSLFLYQRFKKAKDWGHEPDLRKLTILNSNTRMCLVVKWEGQASGAWPKGASYLGWATGGCSHFLITVSSGCLGDSCPENENPINISELLSLGALTLQMM